MASQFDITQREDLFAHFYLYNVSQSFLMRGNREIYAIYTRFFQTGNKRRI
ncbi:MULTISPECIES: glycosyltransferase [Roseburia]|uniref:glycosyltransferase n=1 Tax=Roseburia TaxID=841 RepID=UPI002FE63E30